MLLTFFFEKYSWEPLSQMFLEMFSTFWTVINFTLILINFVLFINKYFYQNNFSLACYYNLWPLTILSMHYQDILPLIILIKLFIIENTKGCVQYRFYITCAISWINSYIYKAMAPKFEHGSMCSALNEQKVVSNSQKSTWENVNAAVTQGSTLGP